MLSEIELEKAGHAPLPEQADEAPGMASAIFSSLGHVMRRFLQALREVTGRRFRRLSYVVGGGGQNAYLDRLIAERTGLEVSAGQ
jgi:sugar (pentulose or hexulose) kinase